MAKMNTWIGEASHFAMLPFDLLCDLFCLVLILILFTFYYSFVYIYSSNDVSLVFAIGCCRWLAGWRLCFYFFVVLVVYSFLVIDFFPQCYFTVCGLVDEFLFGARSVCSR